MNTRSLSRFLAATMALTAIPAFAQESPKPNEPVPPRPRGGEERGKEPGRPPGPPQAREGGREERRPESRRESEGGKRPDDGERREGHRGGSGDSDRGHRWQTPPPAPRVPTPYVGVVTFPPPAVLGAQLGLKEGFGLVVAVVMPDSPAARAGLQKYDVLTKFNDQHLVDAGQFSTLVRGAGKDTEATLTILREAKEQKIAVKIGERLTPTRPSFPHGIDPREHFEKWRGPAQDGTKKMQDRMREYGEKMREYQERLKGWQKNPSADQPQPPKPSVFDGTNDTAA